MDPSARSGGTRTLGVVGTLVWDTIHHRQGRDDVTEEWGGIGYALESLSAALPGGWDILPLVKVGRDLSEEAFRFFRELPRVRPEPGVVVVPEPNNRVELRYSGLVRRAERLTGGVPPWRSDELAPLAELCDAIYINFISGFELELDTAIRLRSRFQGPLYADLHSLFLGIGRRGDRVPRPLPRWLEWLRSFDAVQMNEDEFALLGRARGDSWMLAADALGEGLGLITVTLGARGAAYVAKGDFDPNPFIWPRARERLAASGPVRSGRVEPDGGASEGDPTGCGDVWGSTCFAGLLAGHDLEDAMALANRAAGRNLSHRGARGLALHLAGRVDAGGPGTVQR